MNIDTLCKTPSHKIPLRERLTFPHQTGSYRFDVPIRPKCLAFPLRARKSKLTAIVFAPNFTYIVVTTIIITVLYYCRCSRLRRKRKAEGFISPPRAQNNLYPKTVLCSRKKSTPAQDVEVQLFQSLSRRWLQPSNYRMKRTNERTQGTLIVNYEGVPSE